MKEVLKIPGFSISTKMESNTENEFCCLRTIVNAINLFKREKVPLKFFTLFHDSVPAYSLWSLASNVVCALLVAGRGKPISFTFNSPSCHV